VTAAKKDRHFSSDKNLNIIEYCLHRSPRFSYYYQPGFRTFPFECLSVVKDLFSDIAGQYQQFRPAYPVELLETISSLNRHRHTAWDCATGNGQIAGQLSQYYQQVFATDISAEQLQNAIVHDRIHYSRQPAEKTNFPDKYFDLIIVGQAVHWFSFDDFYREVNRTLKPDGILALVGYHLIRISREINEILDHYYYHIVDAYWDPERTYLEEWYKTIPFPFKEIEIPDYFFSAEWTFDQLAGFLGTWSALKHYIKARQANPLDDLLPELREAWGHFPRRAVLFPIFTRIGSR